MKHLKDKMMISFPALCAYYLSFFVLITAISKLEEEVFSLFFLI